MGDDDVPTGHQRTWSRAEGLPRPLGATWIEAERAYNFALYSKHAESVSLLLYREGDLERPMLRVELDPLRNKSGRIWHCRVEDAALGDARYYAYAVSGPRPAGRYEWHAFDADKVLVDPYAKVIFVPPSFDRAAAVAHGSNAGRAALGVLTREDWLQRESGARVPHPAHDWDTVIYELHVRGFTRHRSSGIPSARRGTFAGVAAKIPYLRDLGITAVELMPVFQFDPSSGDYWGYSPLSFFAPHRGYGETSDAREEFRTMVRALHDAGIEVLLDVVYNHTGELGHEGPTYSLKGLDNSTYYLATGDHRQPWANFTGAGNTMNCANQMVRSMILDSMRYWTHDMHVDGFRFDLASIFARRADGSLGHEEAPIFGQISGDPDFAHVRLIAEPWDPTGVMEPGRAFPGIMWQQWNSAFRDDIRRFVRGDPGLAPALARRLYGSDDLFPDDRLHAYHPWQGVNYVTCHDGFTLYDLVSYNEKHNWANGEHNRDGPVESHSWNCGWEGDEHVPGEVLALRKRQAKNFIALLLLANGTPMLRAGDEFLQTQHGNDNPYNQDNETSWLDWTKVETNREMFRFVRMAIAFRKRHPSIGRSRFWREDVRWLGARGRWPDFSRESRCIAYYLDGASQDDDDLYVMINGGSQATTFELQEGDPSQWRRVMDTSEAGPHDFLDPEAERVVRDRAYALPGRSVAVFRRSVAAERTDGRSVHPPSATRRT